MCVYTICMFYIICACTGSGLSYSQYSGSTEFLSQRYQTFGSLQLRVARTTTRTHKTYFGAT